jgi:hypothetical protein
MNFAYRIKARHIRTIIIEDLSAGFKKLKKHCSCITIRMIILNNISEVCIDYQKLYKTTHHLKKSLLKFDPRKWRTSGKMTAKIRMVVIIHPEYLADVFYTTYLMPIE